MTEQKIEISSEQAQRMARFIYADIASFVSQHQDEFALWKEEQQKRKEMIQ